MQHHPRTLVVVPTYNEAPVLAAFLAAVEHEARGVDVLVVDDASPDGTGLLAEGLAATRVWVRVLHRQGKDGLGAAYRDGFAWALAHGYERIGQLDADLSHPPAAIAALAAALDDGADVAIGSRYVPGGATDGWPRRRLVLSRAAALGAHLALGLPQRDLSGGFKLWRADALRTIDVGSTRAQGFVFHVETTLRSHRAGLTVVEVPFTSRKRVAGESKLGASFALEGVRTVARLRRDPWRPSGAPAPAQRASPVAAVVGRA
jgi:dolichol-phosphate mannosyltransferase